MADRDEKTDKKRRFVYDKSGGVMDAAGLRREIKSMTAKMRRHAENLEFEEAGALRDAIRKMEDDLLLLE
jgi:excinuclease UvrABC helicase subunit UvrB